MTEVYFQRLAAREYRSAHAWYRTRSPRAAERFRLAVGAAVNRIATAAESLPVLEGVDRRVRIKRFPYVRQAHATGFGSRSQARRGR